MTSDSEQLVTLIIGFLGIAGSAVIAAWRIDSEKARDTARERENRRISAIQCISDLVSIIDRFVTLEKQLFDAAFLVGLDAAGYGLFSRRKDLYGRRDKFVDLKIAVEEALANIDRGSTSAELQCDEVIQEQVRRVRACAHELAKERIDPKAGTRREFSAAIVTERDLLIDISRARLSDSNGPDRPQASTNRPQESIRDSQERA